MSSYIVIAIECCTTGEKDMAIPWSVDMWMWHQLEPHLSPTTRHVFDSEM